MIVNKQILDAINFVKNVRAKRDSVAYYHFDLVLFETNNNKLNIIASDGFRISVATVKDINSQPFRIAIRDIHKLKLGKNIEDYKVAVFRYPEWASLIAQYVNRKTNATFDFHSNFLAFLKDINNANTVINFKFDTDDIYLTDIAHIIGYSDIFHLSIKERFTKVNTDYDLKSEPFNIAFKTSYLYETINRYKKLTNNLNIKIKEDSIYGFLEISHSDDNYEFIDIIMPYKLNEKIQNKRIKHT